MYINNYAVVMVFKTKTYNKITHFDYNNELEIARKDGNIERLLELIADRKVALFEIGNLSLYHGTPLYRACKKDDAELVHVILRKLKINQNDRQNGLKISLENGNMNFIDILGYTLPEAFVIMCSEGMSDIVQKMIDMYGLELDVCYNYNEALRLALYNSHLKVIDILLKTNRVDPFECKQPSVIMEFHDCAAHQRGCSDTTLHKFTQYRLNKTTPLSNHEIP